MALFIIICLVFILIVAFSSSKGSNNGSGSHGSDDIDEVEQRRLAKVREMNATAADNPDLSWRSYSDNYTAEKLWYSGDNYWTWLKDTRLDHYKCVFVQGDTIRELKELSEHIFEVWANIDKLDVHPMTYEDYKFDDTYSIYYFRIVGMRYRDEDARLRARMLKYHERLFLVREKSNEKDPNAVMVYTENGYHIGYVDRDMAVLVRQTFKYVGIAWVDFTIQINLNAIDAFIHYKETE
jgi:hypothetical protein